MIQIVTRAGVVASGAHCCGPGRMPSGGITSRKLQPLCVWAIAHTMPAASRVYTDMSVSASHRGKRGVRTGAGAGRWCWCGCCSVHWCLLCGNPSLPTKTHDAHGTLPEGSESEQVVVDRAIEALVRSPRAPARPWRRPSGAGPAAVRARRRRARARRRGRGPTPRHPAPASSRRTAAARDRPARRARGSRTPARTPSAPARHRSRRPSTMDAAAPSTHTVSSARAPHDRGHGSAQPRAASPPRYSRNSGSSVPLRMSAAERSATSRSPHRSTAAASRAVSDAERSALTPWVPSPARRPCPAAPLVARRSPGP